MRRPRLLYLVTHPISARLLLYGQLAWMRAAGFDVTVIAAPGADLDVVAAREQVRTIAVPMVRDINPAQDARALGRLLGVVREVAPDVVNASTPKAGLLGLVAAAALRVPVRLYLLRGLRLETEHGLRRAILGATERVAAAAAHDVVAVSASLRQAYVAAGLAPAAKVAVLGAGSSNGVDADRFAPTDALVAAAAAVRVRHGIPAGAGVLGFIGRLDRDKGIDDLLDAFEQLRPARPTLRLMLVSADLADERTPPAVVARVRRLADVVLVPRVDDVRPYLLAMDVLGFPSYREGFPNVVLEAAALTVPAVGYAVTGVRDAIAAGHTGAVVTPGDAAALAQAAARYLDDPATRAAHGAAARARAVALFARPVVWRAWLDTYRAHLAARGLPLPAGA